MTARPEFPASFVEPWKQLLEDHRYQQKDDFPNHHVGNIDSLITTSNPKTLYVGTGHTIFTRALLPAILSAKHSVQFITCYWAASPSLDGIREALLQLALSRVQSNVKDPLKITIGFSSWGLFQKLFHTSSRDGYVYPPAQWPKLGLPDEEPLKRGGIELTVKSLFFTPFSIVHPKFVIVDGQRAWVPSCNVSWERWFEGCIEVEGDIVDRLLAFYQRVWGIERDGNAIRSTPANLVTSTQAIASDGHALTTITSQSPMNDSSDEDSATRSFSFAPNESVPTILLPSPHHRNPRFSFFPFLSQYNPPMTPLNAALLTLFANAQKRITIVTPNVTSWPVVEALLEAVSRGVDVQVRTSKGVMSLEQLVSCGTTTKWCLRAFVKQYQQLRSRPRQSDPEAQPLPLGNLEILYYSQLDTRRGMDDEPVVSHFKMTLVDDEYLVLGSGNMDRASWWTSQELGVLFYLPAFEGRKLWEDVLEKRTEVYFQSDTASS